MKLKCVGKWEWCKSSPPPMIWWWYQPTGKRFRNSFNPKRQWGSGGVEKRLRCKKGPRGWENGNKKSSLTRSTPVKAIRAYQVICIHSRVFLSKFNHPPALLARCMDALRYLACEPTRKTFSAQMRNCIRFIKNNRSVLIMEMVNL